MREPMKTGLDMPPELEPSVAKGNPVRIEPFPRPPYSNDMPHVPSFRLVWQTALMLCFGALGGTLATYAHLPMPWMLGGLFSSALVVLLWEPRILEDYSFPMQFRTGFVALIGVMIGTQVTPELARALVTLPLTVAGYDVQAEQENLNELLAWCGLTPRADALPPQLSGGERQRAALARAVILSPDVILMDLNMPGLGGLSATEMILERRPATRILILSMHDSPEYISTALSHGARGYVLKDVPTDEIKRAIDVVMGGAQYLCPGAEGALAPRGEEREQLTNREQMVLLQLAQGISNKEVAVALDISVRTVETHRKNIRRKLGVSSTAALMRYALEHGVLQGTGANL